MGSGASNNELSAERVSNVIGQLLCRRQAQVNRSNVVVAANGMGLLLPMSRPAFGGVVINRAFSAGQIQVSPCDYIHCFKLRQVQGAT